MKKIIYIVIAIAFLAGIGWGVRLYFSNGQEPVSFRTAKIQRDSLTLSIGATGTVEPEELINVGAQIAGQILSFGKDRNGKTIDYGSNVEDGTILAQIDDSLYQAEVLSAEAQVIQAQASLQRSYADQNQLKAKLELARLDWERAQRLMPTESLAKASYDSYKAAYEAAQAALAVGDAAIKQAQGSLSYSQAVLQRARRNLSYCTIKSPVKGVIIDRRVNIGQTVVSSLNAPSLFLIAKDLRRMQVWVAVNEADIGRIHPGLPVKFTVDAFPGVRFKGEVGKIRLNAAMTQNVVSYTVEVTTDNSDGKLLPYLTANVQFILDRREQVLTVPNAALRWLPREEQVTPEFRKYLEAPATGKMVKGHKKPQGPSVLWLLKDNELQPVEVTAGISDGVLTEVSGSNIKEGMTVVTGISQTNRKVDSTTNPFTPQLRRRH